MSGYGLQSTAKEVALVESTYTDLTLTEAMLDGKLQL